MTSLFAFVVLLGVLIFVHEAGHFLAAKWAKIWVHRFALGLGAPIKALSFTRNGTEYSICWVPLGGYVKMASREEEATTSALEGATPSHPVPEGMYYEDVSVWKRMIVTLAGVTMNLILALVIYFGLALTNGRTVVSETRVGVVEIGALPRGAEALRMVKVGDRITRISETRVNNWNDVQEAIMSSPGNDVSVTVNDSLTLLVRLHSDQIEERAQAANALYPFLPAVVGQVIENGVAAKAGIVANDTLRSVDGIAVAQWYDLVKVLRASPGKRVTLEVAGPSGLRKLTMVPDSVTDSTGAVIGQVGIYVADLPKSHEPLTVAGAMVVSWDATATSSLMIFRTLRGMLTQRVSARNLGGPIAIGQMAGQALKLGVETFLTFMALISVNLAVLNLLPIPILDGGQFLFLAAEGIIRRPLSLKLRENLMYVGLVLIGLLMIFAFWNDFRRLFGW
jgi:regulator of sigma E protease